MTFGRERRSVEAVLAEHRELSQTFAHNCHLAMQTAASELKQLKKLNLDQDAAGQDANSFWLAEQLLWPLSPLPSLPGGHAAAAKALPRGAVGQSLHKLWRPLSQACVALQSRLLPPADLSAPLSANGPSPMRLGLSGAAPSKAALPTTWAISCTSSTRHGAWRRPA